MPPVILWMLGAVGAVAATRWLVREARRVNAQLHPEQVPSSEERASARKLVRDPQTGVYRPK